jgi:hypothetical protein
MNLEPIPLVTKGFSRLTINIVDGNSFKLDTYISFEIEV